MTKTPAPWRDPSWLEHASSWIDRELERLGLARAGPLEEVKSWCLSCVLRVPVSSGPVYFKAVIDLPLFVNEPVVMTGLSRLYPAHVPLPLAIDESRRWMLLPDLGQELGWQAPIEQREAAILAFARLQVDSTRRSDELLAIGCLDRRLPRLAEQIDPLLDALPAFDGLEAEQIAATRSLGPKLKELCRELVQSPIPEALVHGDLHMSNAAFRDGTYQFFDWSDPSVSHPFFDMISIVYEKDEAVQRRLRDRYLGEWAEFATKERLLEIWDSSYPLCALYQAVSYRHILANADHEKKDFDWAMPFWIGKVLAALSGPNRHPGANWIG